MTPLDHPRTNAHPSPHSPTIPSRLTALAAQIADRLTNPSSSPKTTGASLADGATGIALLHLARAHTGHGTPSVAHSWLAHATAGGVPVDEHSGLFHGAPALAFALHTAARQPGDYARALNTLDTTVLDLTRQRLDAAHRRIDHRKRPGFAEYDVLRGLTGLGAHHLRRHPTHPITTEVLTYLVRLTLPLSPHDDLPGWWTHHGPNRHNPTHPDGHGNLGMAHGITGPLALLALATRHGITVDDQHQAIDRICTWLDTWRQDGDTGHHWPETLTPTEHRTGRPRHRTPHRPSWCYGTPGIARAQQLAAIATGNTTRRRTAEAALLACLRDPAQTARITDPGLCHGLGGLLLTTWRAAHDADHPHLADALTTYLHNLVPDRIPLDRDHGLLDGISGLALAVHSMNSPRADTTWDCCLLIN